MVKTEMRRFAIILALNHGNEIELMKMPGSNLILGRHDVRVDSSCRVRIPSDWYVAMGEPAHVRLMPDPQEKCLDLMVPEVFNEGLSQMKRNPGHRDLAEKLERESVLLRVGAGRRITIPARSREFADIKNICVLEGAARMIKLRRPEFPTREDILDSPLLNDILNEMDKFVPTASSSE